MKALYLLPLLVVLLCLSTTVVAFVPPRPGTDAEANFESVYAYRRRLGIRYQYQPTLLSDEMCKYLNETECERADRSMQDHARAHQDIQKDLYRQRQRQRQRQRLLTDEQASQDFQQQLGAFTQKYGNPHQQPTLEEELQELNQLLEDFNTTREDYYRRRRRLQSDRSKSTHNPSSGTFVVPLLLMKFTDHDQRELPEKYHYQILWNLRIHKWLQENSYGRYDAFFDVQDWEFTDNTEKHYSFDNYGRIAEFQRSFWPLLNSMDERLNGDWSLYDSNQDGYIDNLIVLHSGYGAEEGGEDCTNGRTSINRIWSHAFSDTNNGWVSPNGQYQVRGYNIAAGLDLKCGSDPAKMGVMTHEYLHTFFLIDLYDLQFVGKGLGNFDVMAYPYGHQNDGYIPVHLSPWARQTIEWQTCTEITSSGEYTMEPAAFADSCYKIVLLDYTKWEEYLLLENRQQANFDINFWKPGLVVYHIDEGADDQKWAGAPGFPDWPYSGDHYRVAVAPADGSYDLENANNIGDKAHIWEPGMVLRPNLDNQTYPNTDSYQDGIIEMTGITIEVLEPEGMNVRIKVTFPERSEQEETKPDRTAFSAPQRERDNYNELADEQFTVPDDPEHRISGMIPQLPWFDEWQGKDGTTFRNSTMVFTSTSAQQDASGSTSAHGCRSGYGAVLLAALTGLVTVFLLG